MSFNRKKIKITLEDKVKAIIHASKRGKIEYSILAKHLNISVNTLKRILNELENTKIRTIMDNLFSSSDSIHVVGSLLNRMIRPLEKIDLGKVKKTKTNIRRTSPESAILMLSDIHTGKKTESFGFDVLCKRFDNLYNSIFSIISILRKSYNIDKLYIFGLGDIVDGDGIYRDQAHHIDKEVIEQVFDGSAKLVEFLLKLSKIFSEIEFFGIPGNHGRLSKFTHGINNFDTILYELMKRTLQNYEDIKINVIKNWWDVVNVKGHKFLLVHGGQVRTWLGIPFYGIIQSLMRWTGSLNKDFDYMSLGHFHVIGDQEWNEKEMFLNGTFVTDDDWALQVLKLKSTPRQWFLGVHRDRGITWRYKLNLEG